MKIKCFLLKNDEQAKNPYTTSVSRREQKGLSGKLRILGVSIINVGLAQ